MRGTAPFGKHPGIHLSWNTLICMPSPTLHIIHFSITCLALSKLCQAKEPVEHFPSKIDSEGKYLVLNTLYSRDSFSVCNLQICLASIASLNLTKSLNPIPPSTFDLHKIFQLFQWIFRWPPRSPHQNFLICISISFHKPTGNLKQVIANVGIA